MTGSTSLPLLVDSLILSRDILFVRKDTFQTLIFSPELALNPRSLRYSNWSHDFTVCDPLLLNIASCFCLCDYGVRSFWSSKICGFVQHKKRRNCYTRFCTLSFYEIHETNYLYILDESDWAHLFSYMIFSYLNLKSHGWIDRRQQKHKGC